MAGSGLYFFHNLREIEITKFEPRLGANVRAGTQYECGPAECFHISFEDITGINPRRDVATGAIVGTVISQRGQHPKITFEKPGEVFAALGVEVPEAFKAHYGIEYASASLNADFEGAVKTGDHSSTDDAPEVQNKPTVPAALPQP